MKWGYMRSAALEYQLNYNPRDIHHRQGSLFDLPARPLDDLRDMSLQSCSGRAIDFKHLYRRAQS
jgi:hypothetical protein